MPSLRTCKTSWSNTVKFPSFISGGGGRGTSSTYIITFYSETCLNRTSLGPTFVFGIDTCSVHAQFILTKTSYIGTLFKAWFIQDSSLLGIQFRLVLLYVYTAYFDLPQIYEYFHYSVTFPSILLVLRLCLIH